MTHSIIDAAVNETRNPATLEQLLADVRDRAGSEHPWLAEVMREAVAICQSRHAVHAGTHLQLQAALASIRAGRSDDAARYIEIAIDIEERWAQ